MNEQRLAKLEAYVKELGPLSIYVDPTGWRVHAVASRCKYDRGEFLNMWIARQVSYGTAEMIVAIPDLITALRDAWAERDGLRGELDALTLAKIRSQIYG